MLDTSRDVAYIRYVDLIGRQKERVGRQIRKARRQSGLSHDKLAARVGTSRQHLIKLEKGMHLPGDGLLEAIARETGKSEAFFEGDEDDEEAALSLDEMLRLRIRQLVREEVEAVA